MLQLGYSTAAKVCDRGSGWEPPTGDNVWHLPGFVEGSVTYESHDFWVVFEQWEKEPDAWRTKPRPDGMIWCRNGAGVYSLAIRCMFARPLRDMMVASMTRPAFMMCWGVFELAASSYGHGRTDMRDKLYDAFVNGKLKKRKIVRQDAYNVWIEQPKGWKNLEAVAYLNP